MDAWRVRELGTARAADGLVDESCGPRRFKLPNSFSCVCLPLLPCTATPRPFFLLIFFFVSSHFPKKKNLVLPSGLWKRSGWQKTPGDGNVAISSDGQSPRLSGSRSAAQTRLAARLDKSQIVLYFFSLLPLAAGRAVRSLICPGPLVSVATREQAAEILELMEVFDG